MLEKINKPDIDIVELKSDGKYGKFVLAPLERGYGITLGNSLRRVLLSSLPGVAVTSVKLSGKDGTVHHELSTIPGVKEDVTEIILSIKGLTAKLYGEGPKTVYIEAEGECEITAGDIKTDSEVNILDPGMHIATLGKDAKLYMEITIDRGRGYVSAERNKKQINLPVDVIAVDSIYTPVLKVNYTVEDTRLGQVTDYDKLTMEVWTDGTISAKEALSQAANLLGEHLSVDPRSVYAYIIGEHGDSEIAVWSSANVSGVPLNDFCELRGHFDHIASMKRIAENVKNSAYEIIEKKGATYYGIAMSVRRILEAIVRDEKSILPVSCLQHDNHGISDITISMPAIVGRNGVEGTVPISLSEEEISALKASAETLRKVADEVL